MDIDAEFEHSNAVYCTTVNEGCTLASGIYSNFFYNQSEHDPDKVNCNAGGCERGNPLGQCVTCAAIGTMIQRLAGTDPERILLQVPKKKIV